MAKPRSALVMAKINHLPPKLILLEDCLAHEVKSILMKEDTNEAKSVPP